MVGAIIGAAVSAGSALANWLTTKRQNQQIKDDLRAEQAAAKSQEVTDRYGNWRYSGANQYFTRAADEMKDYVRQQRGRNKVVGGQNTGAEEAAGKVIAQAAGQSAAQRESVGLDMAMQDRRRYQQLKDQERGIDRAQSLATTQAWTQVAQAGAGLATALDGKVGGSAAEKPAGGNAATPTSGQMKFMEDYNNAVKAVTPASQAGYKSNSIVNFDGMSQAQAEELKKQLMQF